MGIPCTDRHQQGEAASSTVSALLSLAQAMICGGDQKLLEYYDTLFMYFCHVLI